jgi:hypothetical protein
MRQLSPQEIHAVAGAATAAATKPSNPLLQLLALPFAAIYLTAIYNATGGSISYFDVLSEGFDQIFAKK